VVPSSTSGLEPLCAAYRSELAPLISSAFSAGERSIHAFLASLGQRVLIVDGSDKLADVVINLNRPSDWQHFIGTSLK
jgi:molybdopterin-guanine dinucleotide biosynthesis protein A